MQDVWIKYIYLTLLGLVASFFMFFQMSQVPPPFPWLDEASGGYDAMATLRGNISLYYPEQGGGGNLWTYLAALMFWFTGPNILVLRWLVGLVGVLSVLCAFGVSSELFRTFMPLKRAWAVAFLAALWLAISTWHVTMSRVAWPPSLVPLIVSLTFLFLWRGLRTGRLRNFLGMGLALGLSVYLYVPGRFIVIVPLTFFALEAIISLTKKKRPEWRQVYRQLLFAAGAALAIALPMLMLFIATPEAFFGRAREVYALNEGSPVDTIVRGVIFHADTFGFTLNLARSPFERLTLGSITTLFFLIGLLVTIWRITIPASRFMIIWWFLLLVPSLIAPPPNSVDITYLRRPIGSLPVTFAFPALALEYIEARMRSWTSPGKLFRQSTTLSVTLISLVAIIAVALTARQTLVGFFEKWANSPEALQAFDPTNVQLVQWMNEHTTADNTFVFPLRTIRNSSTRPWIYVVGFLYEGSVSFIPDREEDIPAALLEAVAGKSSVYLLTEQRGVADPKGVFSYLLHRLGQLDIQEEKFGFQVEHFDLSRWQLEESRPRPETDVLFGQELLLQTSELGVTVNGSRRLLWLELVWKNLASQADYQVTVRLEDAAGHLIAQQDKLLLNDLYGQATSNWEVGAIESDYYWLEIPAAIRPGDYLLRAGVYNSQTGQMVLPKKETLGPDSTVLLESVTIGPPAVYVQDVSPATPIGANFGPGSLTLVGVDAPLLQTLQAGQSIDLPLLLQFEDELPADANLQAGLILQEQFWPLSPPVSIASLDNWPVDTPFYLFIEGKVPREVLAGSYSLALLHGVNGDSTRIVLGDVKIFARNHQFTLPPVDFAANISEPFGNVAHLLGYELDLSQVQTDGFVKLTLYWQALTETDVSYKVFVHLLDSAGMIITQVDREPQGGEALTTSWLVGEVISDVIKIPVDSRLAEVQTIAVGLYNPLDGRRLPIGQEDKLLLPLQP